MRLLTPSQLGALTSQIGFIRYLRDLPMLNYHFSKLGPEGWKNLVEPDGDPPNPHHDRARAVWLAPYDLPEYTKRPMHRGARRDLARALKRRRVPNWVLNMLSAEELKDLEGGGE